MSQRIILLNKPFKCLCQFTDSEGRDTLANYVSESGFYPAGRLDYDSEGLVVLTDNGRLQAAISDPKYAKEKTYLVQVEGSITKEAIRSLQTGVVLNDGPTLPAVVKKVGPPKIWPRTPPVRYRKNVPESWVKITITEGRNRQVRRMLAHVGFPCLRLIRLSVGNWHVQDLGVGQARMVTVKGG